MPNLTIVCYLSSLLSYGMGFSKMQVLKNVGTEHVNIYDYNIQVTLSMGYYVLAIFLVVIGFLFLYVMNNKEQEIMTSNSEKKLARNRMIEDVRVYLS